MKCQRCGSALTPDEAIEQGGKTVCDECAMSMISPPKACDPWAVKMATGSFTTKKDAVASLQGVEAALYREVEARGRLPQEEAAGALGITPEELKRAFSVLRHLELMRGDRRVDGGADFVLFDA